MSSREKIAWVSLLSTVLIWIPYFSNTLATTSGGHRTPSAMLVSFLVAVILQIVLSVGGGLVIATTSRREPKDERDFAVEASAVKFAYYLVITLGFLTFGMASFLTLAGVSNPETRGSSLMVLSQLILLCFVAGEASRFLMQVIGYRRGV